MDAYWRKKKELRVEKQNEKQNVTDKEDNKAEKCGIIMPISAIDGCLENHWVDVQNILYQAIKDAGFEPNLVSNSDDVGIIQKNIIQNLYDNKIVVCDVSGKNPNVMFELGMRLAFDKPTIIVKDDKTTYSFDTSPIEHITYPRDLRFNLILEFKKELSDKIKGTYEKSIKEKDYSTFLKHFGKFTVAKLETTEISKDDYIINEIRDLRFLFQKYMQKEIYVNRKEMDRVGLIHTECDEILYDIVKKIMGTLGLFPGNEIPITKIEKLVYEYIQNSKIKNLRCFDFDSNICRKKIYDIIQKVSESLPIF